MQTQSQANYTPISITSELRQMPQNQNFQELFGAAAEQQPGSNNGMDALNVEGASEYDKNLLCKMKPSLAYELLRVSLESRSNQASCPRTKKTCLYAFTGKCTNGEVLIGGYCMAHNSTVHQRTYINMHLDENTSTIVPISNRKAEFEVASTSYSLSLPNQTQSDAEKKLRLYSYMMEDRNEISMFNAILSNSRDRIRSTVATSLSIYCNQFKEKYQDYLQVMKPYIESINVKVSMSRNHFELQKSTNYWFCQLLLAGKIVVYNQTENYGQYLIPLKYFYLPDILNVLGYIIDRAPNGAVYDPNVMFAQDSIVVGCGRGVRNAMIKYTNNSTDCRYEEDVREAIKRQNISAHANYDVLIMDVDTTINDAIPLSIVVQSHEKPSLQLVNAFAI